jgi:hypothetical protein
VAQQGWHFRHRVGSLPVGPSGLGFLAGRPLFDVFRMYFGSCFDADDFSWAASGPNAIINMVLALFWLVIIGVPVSWHKCKGGVEVDWIGYWVDYGRFEVGLSEVRTAWIAKWVREVLVKQSVLIREFGEVLGRLGFGSAVCENTRPFLGPIYAWVTALPKGAFLQIPAVIQLILGFLLQVYSDGPIRVSCGTWQEPQEELFRADAKAEGDDVAIGGWLCAGGLAPADAPWFAMKITRKFAPWAFKHGEPFRAIASLELLATLICIIAFVESGLVEATTGLAVLGSIGGSTDNQGNSFLINKMMTTKFPLVAVLMEIAARLNKSGKTLNLTWTPRGQNAEADELSNFIFKSFDPAKRIDISLESIDFLVLHQALKQGEELYSLVEEAKTKKRPAPCSGPSMAQAPTGRYKRLRERDPWG